MNLQSTISILVAHVYNKNWRKLLKNVFASSSRKDDEKKKQKKNTIAIGKLFALHPK